MADIPEVSNDSPTELLAAGRRHLAVRDYNAAAENLAKACEGLAKEHGETGDECAEAYLWYGKALLGLSREENGVLGDGMKGTNNEEEEEENDEEDENNAEEGNEEEENQGVEENEGTKDEPQNGDVEENKINGKAEDMEAESTTEEGEPGPSTAKETDDKPGTSNGEALDESTVNLENEDDVDNLQLAWETLDLARSILKKRAESGAIEARTLLAEVHLALGEVALESETYDKAVTDMVSCLEIQKELYGADDRRTAETHYQIGLANSLASNFEEAITHFKNAANILESRIKMLENPSTNDATIKKYIATDPFYSIEGEIKELKDILPEIREKIQDMMDYKAETIKRVRETLCPSNGEGASTSNGAGSSRAGPKPAASDISHLIKRKRKSSESGDGPASKKINT